MLKVVKKITKVKTVAICWAKCKAASNCDYYKWKVIILLNTCEGKSKLCVADSQKVEEKDLLPDAATVAQVIQVHLRTPEMLKKRKQIISYPLYLHSQNCNRLKQ